MSQCTSLEISLGAIPRGFESRPLRHMRQNRKKKPQGNPCGFYLEDSMGFIDSYKRLEKLCGELLDDDRRVSAYIDAMLSTPRGSYYVDSWDEDLKILKHYRWVRNKISHEPGCTEQNMSEPEDAKWIDEFYSRILNQTDPLSLYRIATRPKSAIKYTQKPAQSKPAETQPQKKTNGCFTWAIIIAVVIAAMILFSNIN